MICLCRGCETETPQPLGPQRLCSDCKAGRFAYRGYLVVQAVFAGGWHVSRDGFHVYTGPTPAAARAAVDSILD